MTTSSRWYITQAKANPDLFRVIYDFNCRPQHWVHPAVLEALPHVHVIKALATTNHGSTHLSAWLTRELALPQDDALWDFEEPRRRLALLSPSTLHNLACYSGAACCWPQIAATVSREQVREIKTVLGEAAHVFALRRGQMVVPESDTVPADGTRPLAAHALNAGWRMLLDAAYSEHPAVRSRIALKLPPETASSGLAKEPATAEISAIAWKRLRKITPEVLTEGELKCFA